MSGPFEPPASTGPGLTAAQQRTARQLRASVALRARELASLIRDRAGEDELDYDLRAMKQPRRGSAFGVFGPRGSAKTTLLMEALSGDLELPCKGFYRVLEPVDLSLAPTDFSPGVMVLMHLRQRLARERPRGARGVSEALDADAEKAFQEMIRAAMRGGGGFEELVRRLAVNVEHFVSLAELEVPRRLRLHWLTARWLRAEALRLGVCGFAFGVDDADLTPENGHYPLLWSLLDELHQPRLILIVSADESLLLERAVARCHNNAALAGELFEKAIPPDARFRPPRFSPSERLAFRTTVLDDRGTVAPTAEIGAAATVGGASKWVADGLARLLSPFPRGLEVVARSLAASGESSGASNASPDATLLSVVAESGGLPSLAEVLREQGLPGAVGAVRWPAESEGGVAWEQVRRCATDFDLTLLGFGSIPGLDGLDEGSPGRGLRRVRSAERSSAWAEALGNAFIAQVGAGRLLAEHGMLHGIWRRAAFFSEITIQELDRAVSRPSRASAAQWLWMCPPDAPGGGVGQEASDVTHIFRFGPAEWLEVMSGARAALPSRFLRYLVANEAKVLRPLAAEEAEVFRPSYQWDRKPRLLPGRVRTLVLLTEALDAVPWARLSESSAFRTPLLAARLSAALLRGAYLVTLFRVLRGEDPLPPGLVVAEDEPFLFPESRVTAWLGGSGPDEDVRRLYRRLFPPPEGLEAEGREVPVEAQDLRDRVLKQWTTAKVSETAIQDLREGFDAYTGSLLFRGLA